MDVLIPAGKIAARVEHLGREISAAHRARGTDDPLHVVPVLKGAFTFAGDLWRAIDVAKTIDFAWAKSYGTGTQSVAHDLEVRLPVAGIGGRHVLLVEDIVDTGRTLERLLSLLGAEQPRSVDVVALLDKPSRRVVDVPLAYTGFEIDDVFVVGYGLDHAERHRDLADLCVLPTSADARAADRGPAT